MLARPSKVIRIADRANAQSSEHKTFNRQIKQIEKLRGRLAAWEAATSAYREKYSRELTPLLSRMTDLRIELVHCLDRASGHKSLTPAQQRKLDQAIAELAAQVLAEREDAQVKEIYNKHNPVDFDSEEAAHTHDVKSFLEDMFDLELGEADEHDSLDGLFERARAQFREKHMQHEAQKRSHEERRSKRTKSARQLERERRAEDDAKRVSQSIREVYRKLVSELHPDRETDPQERARKTELMQRINQAYAKRNLLQLLELQLELEHISEEYIAGLDQERLRHFNAVLKEQIAELKQELITVEVQFCQQFGLSPYDDVNPESVVRDLSYEIVITERLNRALEQDMLLVADPKGIKAWLKQRGRKSRRNDDDFDAPF